MLINDSCDWTWPPYMTGLEWWRRLTLVCHLRAVTYKDREKKYQLLRMLLRYGVPEPQVDLRSPDWARELSNGATQ